MDSRNSRVDIKTNLLQMETYLRVFEFVNKGLWIISDWNKNIQIFT
jgi:hypothetical protein